MGQFEKSQQVHLSGKEGEAISATRKTVTHDAENLGLVPTYEAKSGKESTMDQELDICNRVYELATYNTRRVCVTIMKYRVNKPPYIQIRLFTAKENEAMKQVAYVNYTLDEFRELSQVSGHMKRTLTVDYTEHSGFNPRKKIGYALPMRTENEETSNLKRRRVTDYPKKYLVLKKNG